MSPARTSAAARPAVALALAGALAGGLLSSPTPAGAGAGPGPPNVLVILTDDQRPVDTMLPTVMPETLRRFGAEGVTFPNAVATTPLCCPARAGLMTGQFSHNNGVRTNGDPEQLGDHRTTLQHHLDQSGYQTALVGKFLNQWKVEDDPPHWDRWSMMDPGPDYFNTQWNIDGTQQTVTDYATDFTSERAVQYLDELNMPVNDDQPWFLLLSPFAPHAPYQPAPEYAAADVGVWPGNPAVFEANKKDKRQSVRKRKRSLAEGQQVRDAQLRMLMSVDDMVEDVFDRLVGLDELQDTIAVFLSDNGFLWSDHGLGGKKMPYLPSIGIPFHLRWPGRIAGGTVDPRLVANIDVAPTVLDAAGVRIPSEMDGQSLLRPEARTKILTESWNRGHQGGWASILTPQYQYVEWYRDDNVTVDFRDLYPLVKDPFQLRNLLGDRTEKNDSYPRGLRRELRAARTCGATTTPCRSVLTQNVVLCAGREAYPGQHVVGTAGRDRLNGRRGDDLLCGFEGRDRLRGGKGDDLILGGPHRDFLQGGRGKDACRGGPGKDVTRACERGRRRR